MALANRRTTLLLVGIAVVFTIVLIILCLTPSHRPHYVTVTVTGSPRHGGEGRTPTTPENIIKPTDPTTAARTTKTSTTEKFSTEKFTTEKFTTETSTTEPDFTDGIVSKTTNEDYISYYDSSSRANQSTTQSESSTTTSATTTTTQEPSTTTESYVKNTSTATILSTAMKPHAETPSETEENTESTTKPNVSSSKPTESDNGTTIGLDVINANTTLSDTTTEETRPVDTTEEVTHAGTTTKENIPQDTTTEKAVHFDTSEEVTHAETTTEKDIPQDTTAEASTVVESSVSETTTVEETSPLDETTMEEITLTSTTPKTITTTTRPTEVISWKPIKENETECSHPDCKQLAARMLDMIDHRVSPCKDFYQYACGGVEDDLFLHPEDPNKDIYDRILRALQSPNFDSIGVIEPAREYFKSCVAKPVVPSEDDLSLLQDLVSRHGRLDPRTVGADREKYVFIDEDVFDLQKMLADFIIYDFAPIFEVGLDVDKTDTTKFSVRLSLPLNGYDSVFGESIDTSHCKSQYEQTVREAVRERMDLDVTLEYEKLITCRKSGPGHGAMIERLTEATKALNLTGHVEEADLATKLLNDTVYNANLFVQEIKEIWPDFSDLRFQLINKNYTEYRVSDLDSRDILTNKVKWGELLQAIVGRPVDKVQVYHEQELMGVLKRMTEEEPDSLRNMLLMLWAGRLYTDLVAPASSSPNSAEYCASVTQYLAPDMAALIYLQSFSEADLDLMKKKVDGVVNNVKNTVQAALKRTPGVSKVLQEKLLYTFTQVGGAQHLQELTESVSNSTQQLSLTGSYVAQSLELLKRRHNNLFNLLGDDTHTALWRHFSAPNSRTATTLYGTNTILIPEGVMAPPLMYPAFAALPNYLLYAGIGHLVAHEFLHAIDTTGIKFDAMSRATLDRPPLMDEQEYCISQFLGNNFTLPVQKSSAMSFRLPAHLHLNELMADSGATRLAWLAYLHGETAQAGTPTVSVEDDPSRRRRRSVPSTDSHELPLPWLNMTPYQLYLLRTAQTQCASTSDIDVIALMEHEHMPARLRVNLLMITEPLFAEAFKCPSDSNMKADYTCPFVISHIPDE